MQRIDRYQVLREIARGGFGVVYLGFDASLEREVAIKVLSSLAGQDATRRRRFMTECRSLAKLSHPNIVRVYAVGEVSGCPYIVMDWITGESLETRIERDGPLDPRAAASFVIKLASALNHAHDHGIVHRDIKPGNVVLSAQGEPLLTDFGLARDLDTARQTATGVFAGSPGYWPPEQARGVHDQIGPHTDVYSLGATLYALLTGSPPFVSESLVASLAATVDEIPLPPSTHRAGIDPALDAICLRCLEKAPEDRYPTALDLAQELEAFLAGELTAPASRGGVSLIALSAVALLAVATFGGAALLNADPPPPSPTPAEDPMATSPTPVVSNPTSGEPSPSPTEETPDVATLLAIARDYSKQRRYQATIAILDRALKVDPEHVDALLLRAVARSGLGDFSQADADLSHALTLKESAQIYSMLGSNAILRLKPGEAIEHCNRCLELDPRHVLGSFTRGMAYKELGKHELARDDFQRALAFIKDQPENAVLAPRVRHHLKMSQRALANLGSD